MKSSIAKTHGNKLNDLINLLNFGHTKNQSFSFNNSQSRHTYNSHHEFTPTRLVFSLLVVFAIIITTAFIQKAFQSPTLADNPTYPHGPVEESTVSLTTSGDIEMELNPTPTGDNITIQPSTTTISTNNATGYNLTVNTDSATDNKLTHRSTGLDTYHINSLASNDTPLIASSWGYTAIDPSSNPTTSNFNKVPTNTTPTTVKTADQSTTNEQTTLYYGAKVSYSQIPAGQYGNTIVYTALTNPVDAPTITNVTPNTGLPAGGDTITLTGTNFDSLVNIAINDKDCTDISITSATTATCNTPADDEGVVDVVVTGQGGTVTLANGFTYRPPPTTCESSGKSPECIEFTVNVGTTGTYSIPASGLVAYMNHTYDWDVYVDGYLTDACPNGNCTGTSSTNSTGIVLNGLSDGQHSILIVSSSNPVPGWGNAFGHYSGTSGANAYANKNKIRTIDAPITTMAFAPKTSESITNASYMFANLFRGCSNLTTTITILDTYKLPSSVTNLSDFLSGVHSGNNITNPIDLSPLSDWFDSNNSITNLSGFLSGAHDSAYSIQNPVDLNPISNWFVANSSITDLSNFLASIHAYNNTQSPIDLAPVSGWFNANNSITKLSGFLSYVHLNNSNLDYPINLSPIENWFSANNSVTSFAAFLSRSYHGSNLQYSVDLTPISAWFSANDSITYFEYFLEGVHFGNSNLQSPIDLTPVSDWFNGNESITQMGNFLSSAHYENDNLQSPIDLTPVSDWFNGNTSVYNLNAFLSSIHESNYNLASPIDLTPLSGWFDNVDHLSFSTDAFYRLHYDNRSLSLNGQITFPMWAKSDKFINDVSDGYPWFYEMFYSPYTKAGDTSEVKFEDGTVLSSVGEPEYDLSTYNGRTGINPLNNVNGRWKSD